MNFIDIIFAALLAYTFYKGVKNGLFTEIASLVSIVVGIYVALKFSFVIQDFLAENIKTNPKTIQIFAFVITFLIVIVCVYALANFFTGLFSFAHLGWLNKIGGGVFSALKTILLLGVAIHVFERINLNNWLVKEETTQESLLYKPVQNIAKTVYPMLDGWYGKIKEKTAKNNQQTEKDSAQ
jgi:membrane protein required for colicin V production